MAAAVAFLALAARAGLEGCAIDTTGSGGWANTAAGFEGGQMQRIRADISEREAYERYVLHLKAHAPQCGCRPAEGLLCAKGVRLHGAWRAAAEQETRP